MTSHIRRAVAGDEGTLRSLRLQALTDAPAAFASSYEREVARTTADWQRWLAPDPTFILEHAGEPRGLVAGVRDQSDQGLVHLMAMWVHPDLRRSGAADALVGAVIAWAAEQGAREVRLNIAKGNERARRCYERNGFRPTGRESVRQADGFTEVELVRPVR